MNEHYFLFAIGLIWCIFALIQDLRKREIFNWVSYSLAFIALAYRAFYSIDIGNWNFFLYGLAGFVIFYAFSSLVYYSGAFGGGDVRLLSSLGTLLPFYNNMSIILVSLEFLLIFLIVGALYTLIYSIYLAVINRKKFKVNFSRIISDNKRIILMIIITIIILSLISLVYSLALSCWFFFCSVALLFLFIYLKALDECMIIKVKPDRLTEGDWIIEDIMLKNYRVKKTIHGLSIKDIEMLRKFKKEVYIRTGIPFVPSILISFIVMVFFSVFSKQNLLIRLFA